MRLRNGADVLVLELIDGEIHADRLLLVGALGEQPWGEPLEPASIDDFEGLRELASMASSAVDHRTTLDAILWLSAKAQAAA